eukprot:4765090-Pyramimonas_sp.AAC.1
MSASKVIFSPLSTTGRGISIATPLSAGHPIAPRIQSACSDTLPISAPPSLINTRRPSIDHHTRSPRGVPLDRTASFNTKFHPGGIPDTRTHAA